MARRFFFVSLGILALSIAYHTGAVSVDAEGHLDERFAPVLIEGPDNGSPLVGWLDRETGCFTLGAVGANCPGRRGSAPQGTRYVTFSYSGPALRAYANNGTYYYALFYGCYSPDTLDVGPWIGPNPIGVCYDPTSVPPRSDFASPESMTDDHSYAVLHSPRPNPFNPSTEIAFTLDTEGKVEVSVYSPSGQLVRRLVEDHLGAGSHAVAWDGRDDAGRSLASGTYVYQLRVNGRVVGSEKAVVLR